MPNSEWSVKPLPSYGDLSIFKRATISHVEVLKIRNFAGQYRAQRVNSEIRVIMPNSVAVGQPITNLAVLKMATVRHRWFPKIRFFGWCERRGSNASPSQISFCMGIVFRFHQSWLTGIRDVAIQSRAWRSKFALSHCSDRWFRPIQQPACTV